MTKLRTFEPSVISSRSERVTFAIRILKSVHVISFLFLVGLTTAPAQTFTSLLSFDGFDGAFPQGSLVECPHGKFYGTTPYGGAYYAGTVFEITTQGKVTTLHSFDVTDDGGRPYAGLIRARTGNLYGVTSGEGLGTGVYGTVFEITPTGKLTTLYTFCSQQNCTDGSTPYGGLVEGSNGNFYGTTYAGGAHLYGGTVFEITPKGKLTTLYSFCSPSNCIAAPYAGLVQGRNGNFYGTAYAGGSSSYGYGGAVFEITPKGKLTTLYSFCAQPGCVDGRGPVAGLMQAKTGKFYGTTFAGGLYGINSCGTYGDYGCGTVFKLAVEPNDRKTFAEGIDGNNSP